MELAVNCYALANQFPHSELFGMTSQVRRAYASIPANIAEGHGRDHTGRFIQALRIAPGSLKELETHLILANRSGIPLFAILYSLALFCWPARRIEAPRG